MKKLIVLIASLFLLIPCKASAMEAFSNGINEMGNLSTTVYVNGYQSGLTDLPLNYFYPSPGEIYGVTDFTNKLIWISSNQKPKLIEETTLHEFAHAISEIYGLKTNGVQDILFAEMPNLYWYQVTHRDLDDMRGFYCTISKDEYFSEAFATYFYILMIWRRGVQ